ncbi:MAG: carbon-nitrogen hydrolase family protein [Spirochaetaceae bacterium]|nr:MAG: carbon-nitrogen hydrolase family protein [Spirochaetaceae bacterium]
MKRYLNLGILQMPIDRNTETNLNYICAQVERMMDGYHRPELIVGVEEGICSVEPQPIPGPATKFLCEIARKHGIYFLPGSMAETHPDLQEGRSYNTAPVINPAGDIIAVYRKICPWHPAEPSVPGREYVVFPIPEKQTKIGVEICYDMNFPEISRNLALLGAEVIVKMAADPDPLYQPYRCMPITRALENQLYYVATNGVGEFYTGTLYGRSMVVDPEATVLWEAGEDATVATITLDLERVRLTREHGAFFLDQNLNLLRHFKPPMPFAENLDSAPVFQTLAPPALNKASYRQKLRSSGINLIGKE